jgi:hypothetical protein
MLLEPQVGDAVGIDKGNVVVVIGVVVKSCNAVGVRHVKKDILATQIKRCFGKKTWSVEGIIREQGAMRAP